MANDRAKAVGLRQNSRGPQIHGRPNRDIEEVMETRVSRPQPRAPT